MGQGQRRADQAADAAVCLVRPGIRAGAGATLGILIAASAIRLGGTRACGASNVARLALPITGRIAADAIDTEARRALPAVIAGVSIVLIAHALTGVAEGAGHAVVVLDAGSGARVPITRRAGQKPHSA